MKTDWLTLDNLDSQTLRDLQALFAADLEQEALRLDRQVAQLGQINQAGSRVVDCLGPQQVSVPITVWLDSQRAGETFEDPGYCRFIANRYPETAVRNVAAKTQVGWEPSRREVVKRYE